MALKTGVNKVRRKQPEYKDEIITLNRKDESLRSECDRTRKENAEIKTELDT